MGYHTCEICNRTYQVEPRRDDTTRVCSWGCEVERRKQDKYRQKAKEQLEDYIKNTPNYMKGEHNHRFNKTHKSSNCKYCEKEFRAPPSRKGVFCSHSCRISYVQANADYARPRRRPNKGE